MKKGDVIESGSNIEIKIGNNLKLRDIPVGTSVHNVELTPGGGGKLARSAGSSVVLSGYDGDHAIIKLSSGETRKIRSDCSATIGVVSNPDQKNIKIGKAGRNRWRGIRPQSRGVAIIQSIIRMEEEKENLAVGHQFHHGGNLLKDLRQENLKEVINL